LEFHSNRKKTKFKIFEMMPNHNLLFKRLKAVGLRLRAKGDNRLKA